ncbi:MAG: hypothetical protein KDJ52_03400 [Anaerolineae bacterium]|nr:hypothetical protein [Anaerolineae bacterium]
MCRILVLYYSQSGEVTKAVTSFIKHLDTPHNEVVWECIKPKETYPYPWKSVYEFFDVFPECVNLEPPEIEPPSFDPDQKFDLIILAYQVWFLAPSLPIQGFLKSPYARVMQNTKVITLIVCRSMWHSASETMKQIIAEQDGILIDNVVVTFKGPPLATFISTPRRLLSGKKDKFMGLPEAETDNEDIKMLEMFGKAVAEHVESLPDDSHRSLLKGLGAVKVNRRYAVLERIGYYSYHYPWAKVARLFGGPKSSLRRPIIYMFVGNLVLTLPLGLFLALIIQPLISPFLHNQIEDYINQLESPSGS